MAKFSGKGGTFAAAGVAGYGIRKWEFDGEVGLPGSTDSNSGGIETHVIGNKKGSGKLTAFWDDATSPGIVISEGTVLTAIQLNLSATKQLTVTLATVKTFKTTVDVEGGSTVEYEIEFQANGSWTYPA